MSKFLDGTGITDLLNKIKNAFVAKADTAAATGIDVDSTPTANSTNLVTSGGVKAALDGKQDTISDLSTIRSGASAGATAVQPAALNAKQDTLVSGTNIKTLNGASLLGSGNITISASTPVATSIPSGGMLPNVYYDLGLIGTTTSFAKNVTGLDSSILNIWAFGFSVSGTPTISWPAGIKWAGDTPPTITDGKHYEISILNDYAMYAEFAFAGSAMDDPEEI